MWKVIQVRKGFWDSNGGHINHEYDVLVYQVKEENVGTSKVAVNKIKLFSDELMPGETREGRQNKLENIAKILNKTDIDEIMCFHYDPDWTGFCIDCGADWMSK